MDMVVFANAVNGIGAVLLLWAHTQISLGNNDTRGYWLYIISCGLLVIGSAILLSWPVVLLNFLWMGLSTMALWKKNYFESMSVKAMQGSLYLSGAIGIYCVGMRYFDAAAYMTTYIYFIAYALLCAKLHSKKSYLIWCSVGFLLLVPHLLAVLQYSVLISETLGFLIGIVAIIKIIASKEGGAQNSASLK